MINNISMTKDFKTIMDKMKYALKHEQEKFTMLGSYKYISLVNLILLFKVVPALIQPIWPYLQNLLPSFYLYLAILIVLNVVAIFLYNVVMYFIYTRKIPLFQQFRSDPKKKWMWEQNPEKWKPYFIKTLTVVSLNVVVIGPAFTLATNLNRFDILMNPEDRPEILTMVWQNMVFLLVEEILFYFIHRLLHHPKFYWIHKQHHEYNTTIALALVYAHPLEHIFANYFASGVGYTLLARFYPVHIYTVIIWLIFRVVESSDGHCGYDWPWALSHWLPFSAGGNYHYFHHSKNSGNYGAILHIFDTLGSTNDEYIEKERADADKAVNTKCE